MNEFFMYHKEYAPGGQLFTLEGGNTPESLAKEGWVDNPNKKGINLGPPEDAAGVAAVAARFERGELSPVDGYHMPLTQAEIDAANQRALDRQAEEARMRGDQGLRNERHQVERSADMKADAARKDTDKDPGSQYQVPAGAPVGEAEPPAPTSDPHPDGAPAADWSDPAQRKAAIKNALGQVDRNHADNFTSDGRVRMEVVEALLDFDPSREEVDEAEAEIKAEAENAL